MTESSQTARLRQCESAFLGLGKRGEFFKDAQAGVRLLERKECAEVIMQIFLYCSE